MEITRRIIPWIVSSTITDKWHSKEVYLTCAVKYFGSAQQRFTWPPTTIKSMGNFTVHMVEEVCAVSGMPCCTGYFQPVGTCWMQCDCFHVCMMKHKHSPVYWCLFSAPVSFRPTCLADLSLVQDLARLWNAAIECTIQKWFKQDVWLRCRDQIPVVFNATDAVIANPLGRKNCDD